MIMYQKNYNFIRMTVSEPKQYSKMRVKSLSTGVRTVIGFTKGEGNEIESVIFSKDYFTIPQAKGWMNEHGYTIQETYLVKDLNPTSDGFDYIQEVYIEQPKEESNKMSKYDWLFDKRSGAAKYYGD